MTYSRRKARPGWTPTNWERPRVNGKFVRDPDKPAKPYPLRQTRDLSQLRALIMRSAHHLKHMMPPEDDAAATSQAETPLHPAFQRLIGRNVSIMDGLSVAVQLVIRLIDKEREPRDPSQIPPPSSASNADIQPFFNELDEKELDRRIADELDRLASRRRAATGS